MPELAGLAGDEVAHPILRHQDVSLYYRQREDHYGVGNYRHEPIVTPQDAIRRPATARCSRRSCRSRRRTSTSARRRPRGCCRRSQAGCGRTDPARSINGMFSFTPDAGSIVGESAEVRGVWVCEAVWVTHGGGMGRQVAEWMATGEPSYDLAEADANRFYPFMTTPPLRAWRAARSSTARSTTSCIRSSSRRRRGTCG